MLTSNLKTTFFTVKTLNEMFIASVAYILFLPLEHKIHILSQPCNILYVCHHDMYVFALNLKVL